MKNQLHKLTNEQIIAMTDKEFVEFQSELYINSYLLIFGKKPNTNELRLYMTKGAQRAHNNVNGIKESGNFPSGEYVSKKLLHKNKKPSE